MAEGGIDADECVTHMYETVLNHKWGWEKAKTTYLVCKIAGKNPIIKKNDAGNKHAEELLIDELCRNSNGTEDTDDTDDSSGSEEDLSDKLYGLSIHVDDERPSRRKLKIRIYMNNSPCSDCTKKLIKFLDNNILVRIRIYVTNLFNIRRESCKGEEHYKRVREVHNANYSGLRDLMKHARCKIKAFNKEVWKKLFKTANVSNAVRDKLLGRYSKKTEQNDRSRDEEDGNIHKDLDYIKSHRLEIDKSRAMKK